MLIFLKDSSPIKYPHFNCPRSLNKTIVLIKMLATYNELDANANVSQNQIYFITQLGWAR
jgi:hypothetical protein